MPGYLLSDEAQSDLKEISRYTQENWGNKQARIYLAELVASFENLARSPKLGRVREEIEKDVRSFPVGRHIVFYRIGEKCIEVARILHASMDIKRHLT
ncbi:MAG: type II toxin-antitoxin system RelE/ParE family toxin [Candidatus Scalindua sp.]|nr:type II toxin-antitoxin system RelE/ParE family toxin [Candidatus Scalindua sp.]